MQYNLVQRVAVQTRTRPIGKRSPRLFSNDTEQSLESPHLGGNKGGTAMPRKEDPIHCHQQWTALSERWGTSSIAELDTTLSREPETVLSQETETVLSQEPETKLPKEVDAALSQPRVPVAASARDPISSSETVPTHEASELETNSKAAFVVTGVIALAAVVYYVKVLSSDLRGLAKKPVPYSIAEVDATEGNSPDFPS